MRTLGWYINIDGPQAKFQPCRYNRLTQAQAKQDALESYKHTLSCDLRDLNDTMDCLQATKNTMAKIQALEPTVFPKPRKKK